MQLTRKDLHQHDDDCKTIEQLLDYNGTECDDDAIPISPERHRGGRERKEEIRVRLQWREMLRYGGRTERHDTVRTLLQLLRVSNNSDGHSFARGRSTHQVELCRRGTMRQDLHAVCEPKRRALVQRRTLRMGRGGNVSTHSTRHTAHGIVWW